MRIFLILILCPCFLYGQDFTGVWTGTLSMQKSQFAYELVISGEKDDLSGYSLTVFVVDSIENTGIKKIKIKTKKPGLVIEDDKLVFNDYKSPSKKVTMYSKLSYVAGDSPVLEGTFFTRSADKTSFNGTIRLEKKDAFASTKLMKHLKELDLLADLSFLQALPGNEMNKAVAAARSAKDTLASNEVPDEDETTRTGKAPKTPVPVSLPNRAGPVKYVTASPQLVEKTGLNTIKVAADIESRATEIIRSIEFNSDSLVLSLYDNGEVDGDTVSVLANGQVVLAMRGLSTTAIRTTIYTPVGSVDSLQVTMYAENLGRIAPNTGLLVIEAGDEKYQVRFEGDFNKNSAVIFRRKR